MKWNQYFLVFVISFLVGFLGSRLLRMAFSQDENPAFEKMAAVAHEPLLSFVEPTFTEVTNIDELKNFLPTTNLSKKHQDAIMSYVNWKMAKAYNEAKRCKGKWILDHDGFRVNPEWKKDQPKLDDISVEGKAKPEIKAPPKKMTQKIKVGDLGYD